MNAAFLVKKQKKKKNKNQEPIQNNTLIPFFFVFLNYKNINTCVSILHRTNLNCFLIDWSLFLLSTIFIKWNFFF